MPHSLTTPPRLLQSEKRKLRATGSRSSKSKRFGNSDGDCKFDDAFHQIGAHRCRHRCLSRLGRARLGRVCGLFLHPALIAIAVAVFVMAGASVFAGGNLSWCARGSWQPLGHRSLFAARTAGRISAGLRGPEGVLDLSLLARIRAEERMLRTQFGDQYDTYCARTSRLVHGLF